MEKTKIMYARVAGLALLSYFAAGIASLLLSNWPHATNLLVMLTSFAALTLGAMLYMITRDQGPAVALIALICRIIEAIPKAGSGTIYFAVGMLLFSWLFIKGRMIPVFLAWFGLVASAVWVIAIPLQLMEVLPNSITWFLYLLMALFEIPFALWLIVRGVAVKVEG